VAAEGLYQAYWTPDILEEVRRTLLNDLHLTDTQAARRIEAMAAAFPDALITSSARIPLPSGMGRKRRLLSYYPLSVAARQVAE
jgi:hypothetical protein